MEKTPRQTNSNIASPGVIFRKKREFPEGEGLKIQMMPIQPQVVQNRKKYFSKTNPKLQTRFDTKFTKIRQFQNDIDSLI